MKLSRSQKSRDADSTNSPSIQLELEIAAVRAKNIEITKTNSKLRQENTEMRNQIYALQADLLNIQAKYNSLQRNVKNCTPNLLSFLELFLQVSDSQSLTNILHISGKISPRSTPKMQVTHTVKPHTVNGTVLKNPTISLTRLNLNDTVPSPNNTAGHISNLPSTSNSHNSDIENDVDAETNQDANNLSFVSRASRSRKKSPLAAVTPNDSLEFEDDMESEDSSDEEEQHEDIQERLSTIQEESFCSSSRKRTSFGEIRIYLNRSLVDARSNFSPTKSNALFHSRTSSTEAQLSNTSLNFETTVIENPENMTSNSLRADITVFSPKRNSTRVDLDVSNSVLEESAQERQISISAIQSTEGTPTTEAAEDQFAVTDLNRLGWLPTPSLSAIGDKDPLNGSKVNILKELGLEQSPSSNKDDNVSPVSSVTPKRNTRSTRQIKNSSVPMESPKFSKQTVNKSRGTLHRRGGSVEHILTPTIILERLENVLPEHGLTANTINIHILDNMTEMKEESQNSSKKSKKKTRSPKKNFKRKKQEDETENLEEKLKEMKKRLSSHMPEERESPNVKRMRPARAAKPTVLKDRSLKAKLRRM